MKNKAFLIIGLVVGIAIGVYGSIFLSKKGLTERLITEKEAIEYGVAYYHPKTKEFTWKATCK